MEMLTQMERSVFKAIVDIAYDDIGADANEIARFTDIDVRQVRGVLSSLIKKDLIGTYEFEDNVTRNPVTVFGPVNDCDEVISFGCDHYDRTFYNRLFLGVNSIAEYRA